MSPMREALYPLHDGRPHDHRQDLTPYSAVSSFNFPHSCDSTLITPVSLTQSLPVTTTSLVPTNLDLKLSPSDNVSPTYDMFHIENEFGDGKYNPPMKYKHPHGALHISTTDSPFPPSPVVPSTPYWGAYGVSATSISSTSDSSPSLTSLTSPVAPLQHSAGGQPTSGHSFGNHSVPLLIAPRVPSPNSRQPATSATSSSYRQNSLQSISTVASSASSNLTRCSQSQPPAARVAMPVRRRRKSSKHARDSEILLSGQMSHDENILMQLTEVERLPWKDVVVVFRERTGRSMKVPALQMRKKRLVERLREKALSLAFQDQDKVKWDQVAQSMMKHGGTEKWSRESMQKKWYGLHPEQDDFIDEFESSPKDQPHINDDFGMDDWSDNVSYSHQGLPGSESASVSAISAAATTDSGRSRHASDASSHQLQRSLIYEQHRQQQQGGWNHNS